MQLSFKHTIANCVNDVIRRHYPLHFSALCHVYAILGANLISIVSGKNFRPVAGMAAIDCGEGQLMLMTDETALARPEGGAYHCWIESVDDPDQDRIVVDLTFRHNRLFAEENGFTWTAQHPPDFLWGRRCDLVLPGDLASLRSPFPEGKVWYRESLMGEAWMIAQLSNHQNALVQLTAETLRLFNERHC